MKTSKIMIAATIAASALASCNQSDNNSIMYLSVGSYAPADSAGIAIYAFKAPDSPLVFWGSMIPFTSPMVMLARIPFGVPAWELALSIGLLLITFIVFAWISARIYKVGILVSGKKSTFKDLWKWLKQK